MRLHALAHDARPTSIRTADAGKFIDDDTAITRRRDRQGTERRGVDGRRRLRRIRRADVSRCPDGLVGAVRSAEARHAGCIPPQPQARVGLVRVAAQARCKGGAQCRSSRACRTRRARFRFRADHAKRRRLAPARGQSQRRGAARQHRPRQMLPREYDRRTLDRGRRRGSSLRRVRRAAAARRRLVRGDPAGRMRSRPPRTRQGDVRYCLSWARRPRSIPQPRCRTTRSPLAATIVEINPNPTPLSDAADYVLRAPAGVVLPALVAAAWPV